MRRLTEREKRLSVLAGAVAWAVLALAHAQISEVRRWYPDLVAVMAIATALVTATLTFRPGWTLPYRLGGTLGIGTLALRFASITIGVFSVEDRDALWISLASLSTTGMLSVMWWWFWLSEVHAWHRSHRT